MQQIKACFIYYSKSFFSSYDVCNLLC